VSRYDDPEVTGLAREYGGRRKRALRELKRIEAMRRNALTRPERRSRKRLAEGGTS
jgi:hypothetical protein